MANPYLPQWEYIPDGEPRVSGDSVYVYGSHDKAGADSFCDYVLKCWSAPVDNLNDWVCHGDIFHSRERWQILSLCVHYQCARLRWSERQAGRTVQAYFPI